MKKAIDKSVYNLSDVSNVSEQIARFETASPWKKEDIGFTILNVSYPVLHTHQYYEILITLSGSMVHLINGEEYVMRCGDCCLIRPDDCHCLKDDPNGEDASSYLNVNFMMRPAFYDQMLSLYGIDSLPTVEEDPKPLKFSISVASVEQIKRECLLIQTPIDLPTPISLLTCRALIGKLVGTCVLAHRSDQSQRYPSWLLELALDLQNPSNFDKKRSDRIKEIPYDRSYVQKQFRRFFGTSIIDFSNAAKMAYAKDLLLQTDLSILAISQKLGFDSASHFYHLFKKTFNTTPWNLRKEADSASRSTMSL